MTTTIETKGKSFDQVQNQIEILYKNDPLNTLIPSTYKDPDAPKVDTADLGFTINGVPATAIVENLVSGIPGYGAIMSSGFCIYAARAKDGGKTAAEVHSIIDEHFKEFKIEIEQMIDRKLDTYEREQYRLTSERCFRGFAESHLELFFENLTVLKSKLEEKKILKPNDSLLVDLRNGFDSFREHIKELLPLFSEEKYFKDTYKNYLNLVLLHVFSLTSLNYYWYQYGFDQDYATGVVETEFYKATHSYAQKLHLNIDRALSNISKISSDSEGLDFVFFLLEMDPQYYPVALYKEPVVPSFNKFSESLSNVQRYGMRPPIVKIKTSDKQLPFIVKIDAVNCGSTNPQGEHNSGFGREIPSKIEKISGCTGFYSKIWTPKISISIEKPVNMVFRFLGFFDESDGISINYNGLVGSETIKEIQEIKCFENDKISGLKYGYIKTKVYSNFIFANISIHCLSAKRLSTRLLSIECIVSEPDEALGNKLSTANNPYE
ncbi:hypothetical protein RB653_009830 [Dictyostelium firmibasis]|uniref:Pesticidal crystal protein N-terminal domain-containing protein n=1 Tax=Dictyostelium firmibasis TaxID=79012 RepID=A0AAN7TJ78_9MYCE